MAAPDGGWGWACVLGSFLAHFAFAGCTRSFGVVYLEILHRYHSNATSAAWIGAIHLVLWGAFGPVATVLSKQFGERLVAMAGGLIMSGGLICAGFAPNLAIVYLGYCVAGVGLSLTYTPGYSLIGQYFHKRKALAMSIATTGSGVGAFVLSPLTQASIFFYGYTGAMLLLAGILLNTVFGGALLRPLHIKPKLEEDSHHPEQSQSLTSSNDLTDKHVISVVELETEIPSCNNTRESSPKNGGRKHRFNFSLLKYPCFWGMSLVSVFTTVSTGVAWGFTAALAVDRGVDLTSAAFLLSLMAIADIAGRFISGITFDLRAIRPWRVFFYAASVLLLGLSTAAMPLCWSYASLVLVTIIRGLFLGLLMAHRATIMADLVGQKRTPMAFGFVMFCAAVGHLAGRGLGGVLRDATGSYDSVFYMAGASTAASSIIFFIILKYFYKPETVL